MPVGKRVTLQCLFFRDSLASHLLLSLFLPLWFSLLWMYHLPPRVTIFSCLFDICVSYLSLSPEHIGFFPSTAPPFATPASAICVSCSCSCFDPGSKPCGRLESFLSPLLNSKMCSHVHTHESLYQFLSILYHEAARIHAFILFPRILTGFSLLSQSFSEYLWRVFMSWVSWKMLRMR